MELIDVTLRDGGHAVKFDWPIETAREYYTLISKIEEVTYIEMGYWKQTEKTKNTFYNLDIEKLKSIIGENPRKKVSVMIDYHYCTKNLEDYPTKDNQNIVEMIRVCSRKNDIENCLKFISDLKNHTGLKVSLNIFNVSNYETQELYEIAEKVSKVNLDYVYFADTHGSLDFDYDSILFEKSVKLLRSCKIKVGMHLHDHSGRALSNFKKLTEIGFTGFDASTRGMGKGVGNLRLEQVINNRESLIDLIDFIQKNEERFTMRESPYGFLTSKYSITDYYGYHAEKLGYSIKEFDKICKSIKGLDKDVYNDKIWEKNK